MSQPSAPMASENEVQIILCSHVRMNGAKCKSPALRGEDFCYFHHQTHERGRVASRRKYLTEKVPKIKQVADFDIPALEDGTAIQLAMTDVIRAIADGSIDMQQAMLLLRGLRAAAWNLRQVSMPHADETVLEFPKYDVHTHVASPETMQRFADEYFAGVEAEKKRAEPESESMNEEVTAARA